jgi:hypothetical protein
MAANEIDNVMSMAAELTETVAQQQESDSEEEEEEEVENYDHLIIACQKYVFKPFVVAFAVAFGMSTGFGLFNALSSIRLNPFRSRPVPVPSAPPEPTTSNPVMQGIQGIQKFFEK